MCVYSGKHSQTNIQDVLENRCTDFIFRLLEHRDHEHYKKSFINLICITIQVTNL
jgi:hypothetical protein